jgi:hypothetical protein
LAVCACIASNISVFLVVTIENVWVALAPLVVTLILVGWRVWQIYKSSHEGFMAGRHPQGRELLEELHRRTFLLAPDDDVEVSYSPGGGAAWTVDLKTGGQMNSVTFLKDYIVPHLPNHEVAVTDVANLGLVAIYAMPTGPCELSADTASWIPTCASGCTLDITPCVREARAFDHWVPALFASNKTVPSFATLIYTRTVKGD